MPRDLPLSNGRLLVMFDRQCRIRDLLLPQHAWGSENIERHARADLWPACGQTMRDHVRHSDQVPMLTRTAAGGG